jgi:hypothetical protein
VTYHPWYYSYSFPCDLNKRNAFRESRVPCICVAVVFVGRGTQLIGIVYYAFRLSIVKSFCKIYKDQSKYSLYELFWFTNNQSIFSINELYQLAMFPLSTRNHTDTYEGCLHGIGKRAMRHLEYRDTELL